MRKILSKQRGVQFLFCASPVTIDKRAEWGQNTDNLQVAPNGAFLKVSGVTVTHLVQPNTEKSAPVGWMPTDTAGQYDKLPIWVGDDLIEAGQTVSLVTLDGPITYTAKEQSVLCANDKDGAPDPKDQWVQTLANVRKNYEY